MGVKGQQPKKSWPWYNVDECRVKNRMKKHSPSILQTKRPTGGLVGAGSLGAQFVGQNVLFGGLVLVKETMGLG